MNTTKSSKVFNVTGISRFLSIAAAVNLAVLPALAKTSDLSPNSAASGDSLMLAQTSPSTAFTEQAAVRPKEWRFQNEQQWIVDSIGRDVAEILGFAKYQKAGGSQFTSKDVDFGTTIVNQAANSYAYKYSYKGEAPSEFKLNLDEYAWAPKNYESFAKQIMEKFQLSAARPSAIPDDFLKNVAKADFDALFAENKRISAALSENPLDPSLHEQAAMLTAVFNMLEICGLFSDTRAPLARMSAHLSLAKALNNDKLSTVGRIANIALESMACRDGIAVPMIEEEEKKDLSPVEKSILRALKIRGTGNFRYYVEADGTQLEENQHGLRFAQTRGIEQTMEKVMQKHRSLPIQWLRILASGPGAVQTGHVIQSRLVSSEIHDFLKSYNAYKNTSRTDFQNLVPELNLESCRCLVVDGTSSSLAVLSWDDIAAFHGRHIANALCEEYLFNSRMYGVKELAKQTADRATKLFANFDLIPLIKARFNLELDERNKFFVEFQNLVVQHPELVTAHNWTTVTMTAQKFSPQTALLPPELWFDPPMPMGTAYFFRDDLKNVKKDLLDLTEMKRLMPYYPPLAIEWAKKKYGEKPNSEQYREAFGPLADFDVHAMEFIADGEVEHPDKFIPLMEKVAKENPGEYVHLGYYCVVHNKPEDAVKYFEKAIADDENAVRIANCSDWLIQYRYDHGQKDKAKELAEFAAGVYSNRGLQAQAKYFEREGKLKEAESNYRKISERYDTDSFLAGFLLRNASKNPAYATEGEKLAMKYFLTGRKRVKLADLKAKPTEGLKITYPDNSLQDPVLKKDAIIVAINGCAVSTEQQAEVARNLVSGPMISLIVWDGKKYLEVTRTAVHSNSINVSYEPVNAALTMDAAHQKKAVGDLIQLKDNMMKQAIELQKQNLPPAEMLKRLLQQNNLPPSMYKNLLNQQAAQGAGKAPTGKTPAKALPKTPTKKK